MGKVTLKSGGDFKQPDSGTYVVTIVTAADIGTQPADVIKGNGPNAGKHVEGGPRVIFNFELVGQEEEGEAPVTLIKEVNLSLGEKSSLVGLGKAFLGLDYAGFKKLTREGTLDLGLFLGKSAFAVVGESSTGKARLEGFAPLAKGTPVPKAKSELLVFDIDDASDAILSKLPKLIQTKVAQSEERKESVGFASSELGGVTSSLDL